MRCSKKNILIISISIVILLCVISAYYVVAERSSVYAYDVKQNYEYDFKTTDADIFSLPLKDGMLKVPHLPKKWDTAILKIHIKSTFWGKYFQPRIELISSKTPLLQYFEYNSKGIRYIDVSSQVSSGGILKLKGYNTALPNQQTELIIFKNPEIAESTILIIAPHPDDAEIAAYGLYSSSDSNKTYIVTITAGDAGDKKYDEIYKDMTKQYLKKGELRVWNSITVPILGGITPGHAVNLGYFADRLKRMYENKSAVVKSMYTHTSDINQYRKMNISNLLVNSNGVSSWDSLVKDISCILRKVKPNIIVAPYPALDAHPDHKFSTVALFEAIKSVGIKEGYLYLYTNHYALNNFYPYGETYSLISLPPNFGEPLYFHGIYSHPLSIEKQNDKLFALEAMNDLRFDTEWRSTKEIIKKAIRVSRMNILGKNESYFRRAVRANELFYVVKIEDIYNNEVIDKIQGKL